ncbi:hypothetical protein NUU61_004408 [Penicillium alfredii]|uniref:Uncharacterized protein n=1 Tax=Penicillium alfredii TaxID=1506179 RepID=A0A9W9FL23_9EURO|nr:uncharacterized protein NUU61_004408 [Penicillium alfredii]KAJ5102186.1 hypothetical protein NUU61_004408 [Penicillium alfredii]
MESKHHSQIIESRPRSQDNPHSHDHQPLNTSRSEGRSPSTSYFDPFVTSAEPNVHVHTGNAFAHLKPKETEEDLPPGPKSGKNCSLDTLIPEPPPLYSQGIHGSNLPWLTSSTHTTGSTDPSSTPSTPQRPVITRKTSGLDYKVHLALPMPKPAFEAEPPPAEEMPTPTKPHYLKKRAVTDPVVLDELVSSEKTPGHDTGENKKRSKLELIKSKLSFKDLRKECAKDEAASRAPALPAPENVKTRFRRPLIGTAIPSFSSTHPNLKAQIKPVETGRPSLTTTVSSNAAASAVTVTPSRIPLPPSGSFSHAQGTIAPARAPSTRRSNPPTTSEPPFTDESPVKTIDKSRAASDSSRAASTLKVQPEIVVTRPSVDSAAAQQRHHSPDDPWIIEPLNSQDSPQNCTGITGITGEFGPGQLDHNSPTSAQHPTRTSYPEARSPPLNAYIENDAQITSSADFVPSFQERLKKANMPLDQSIPPPAIQNLSTATHVEDIVDMVQAIQKRSDRGFNIITSKLDELSNWIGNQLKSQIDGISDISRVNSELFTKQCQISRELAKFQLDVRLEIGVMERRFSAFEGRILDEVQAEVRALAKAYEELNRKSDSLIAKHSNGDNQRFIAHQRQKNAEIEAEIAMLRVQQQKRKSESSTTSTEPMPKQAIAALAPLPPTPASNHRNRITISEMRQGGMLPRSMSVSKKSLNNAKAAIRSVPEPKEKPLDKAAGSEDGKRWHVFGFRRRRDASDSSTGSGKFLWTSRRAKEDTTTVHDDTTSSRSSTPPIPPIPRNISRLVDDLNRSSTVTSSNIHPAFRHMQQPQQPSAIPKKENINPPQEVTLTSGLTIEIIPEASPELVSLSAHTRSTVSALGDEYKTSAEAGGLSPSASEHSTLQENHPLVPVTLHPSNDDLPRMPLLADPDWDTPDWDKVSFYGCKSNGESQE